MSEIKLDARFEVKRTDADDGDERRSFLNASSQMYHSTWSVIDRRERRNMLQTQADDEDDERCVA